MEKDGVPNCGKIIKVEDDTVGDGRPTILLDQSEFIRTRCEPALIGTRAGHVARQRRSLKCAA